MAVDREMPLTQKQASPKSASMSSQAMVMGYYGAGNVGDESILSGILLILGRETRAVVAGLNPGIVEALHGVPAVQLPTIRNPRVLKQFIREIIRSQTVALGFGGILANSLQRRDLYRWISIGFLSKLLGKRVILCSAGAGPLKRTIGTLVAAVVISSFDVLCVRDYYSFYSLRRIGVRGPILVMADPAYLFLSNASPPSAANHPESEAGKSKKIGIILARRFWNQKLWKGTRYREKYDSLKRIMTSIIDRLVYLRDFTVVMIPFDAIDVELYMEISEMAKYPERIHILPYNPDPKVCLGSLHELDLVIASRYHAVIFATWLGIPVIPIVTHPKVSELVKDLSLGPYAIDYGDGIEWPDSELDEEVILRRISDLLDNPQVQLSKVKQRTRVMGQNAIRLAEFLPATSE